MWERVIMSETKKTILCALFFIGLMILLFTSGCGVLSEDCSQLSNGYICKEDFIQKCRDYCYQTNSTWYGFKECTNLCEGPSIQGDNYGK